MGEDAEEGLFDGEGESRSMRNVLLEKKGTRRSKSTSSGKTWGSPRSVHFKARMKEPCLHEVLEASTRLQFVVAGAPVHRACEDEANEVYANGEACIASVRIFCKAI